MRLPIRQSSIYKWARNMEFMQKYSNEISDEDENEDGDDKSSALDHVVKRDTPDQAAGNWDGAVEGTDRAGNAQIPIVGLQKCQWIESDEEDSDAEDVCQHGVYRDKEFIKQSFLSSSGSDVLSAKEIFDLEIPPPKYLSACSSKSAELASFTKVEQRPQPKQTGSVQSKKSKPETVSVAQRAMNDALFNQLQKQRPSKLAARTNDKETVKDKVKRQRLSGQSGIGSDFKEWRSEEEMRLRQHFDS